MAGFEWKPPEYVEEWRAKDKTPEEQILFDLMEDVMSTGERIGQMRMPDGSTKEMVEKKIDDSFVRRMQAVNPDNWLAEMLPSEDGKSKFNFNAAMANLFVGAPDASAYEGPRELRAIDRTI
jgi:hypothetical protein